MTPLLTSCDPLGTSTTRAGAVRVPAGVTSQLLPCSWLSSVPFPTPEGTESNQPRTTHAMDPCKLVLLGIVQWLVVASASSTSGLGDLPLSDPAQAAVPLPLSKLATSLIVCSHYPPTSPSSHSPTNLRPSLGGYTAHFSQRYID
ncbi:hypothetical protein LIA77_01174 [Sarocladium implicatum]|nr:hypothetical protein LIA77_01174 [Sarocladium implicatum]